MLLLLLVLHFPGAKRKVFEKIKDNGNDFPSFISNNAWLSNSVSVGKGVILYPGVSINYQTVVEDFVIMNMNCASGMIVPLVNSAPWHRE